MSDAGGTALDTVMSIVFVLLSSGEGLGLGNPTQPNSEVGWIGHDLNGIIIVLVLPVGLFLFITVSVPRLDETLASREMAFSMLNVPRHAVVTGVAIVYLMFDGAPVSITATPWLG